MVIGADRGRGFIQSQDVSIGRSSSVAVVQLMKMYSLNRLVSE